MAGAETGAVDTRARMSLDKDRVRFTPGPSLARAMPFPKLTPATRLLSRFSHSMTTLDAARRAFGVQVADTVSAKHTYERHSSMHVSHPCCTVHVQALTLVADGAAVPEFVRDCGGKCVQVDFVDGVLVVALLVCGGG